LALVTLVASSLAVDACSSQNKNNYANAGIAIAAAVAEAAVQRAVTGDCWAQCAYGTHCDEKTGVCVADEGPKTPAPDASAPPPLQTAPPEDDTCSGYCFEDERCIVIANGDMKCVPKKPAAPAASTP
jgi:hypothetical protein